MSEPKPKAHCSVDGCTKALHTAGKCWSHYTEIRQALLGPCTVDGCTELQRCRGLCKTHYRRFLAGLPLGGPAIPGRRISSDAARDRVIEDAEWIVGTDNPDHIARRVGFATTKQLYDALRRWGRQDLVDRCQQWHVAVTLPKTHLAAMAANRRGSV